MRREERLDSQPEELGERNAMTKTLGVFCVFLCFFFLGFSMVFLWFWYFFGFWVEFFDRVFEVNFVLALRTSGVFLF